MDSWIRPQNCSSYVRSNDVLVLGLAVHAVFLLALLLFTVQVMAWLNLLCIAFYLGGFYCIRMGCPAWWLILFTLEIVMHALVMTMTVGCHVGLHYCCLVLGLCPFLCYRKRFINQLGFDAFLMGLFVWLEIQFRNASPYYVLPDSKVFFHCFFNRAVIFFAMVLFGFYCSRATAEEQLAMAGLIQASLIPMLTNRTSCVVPASVCYPINQVRGDFFDMLKFKEEGKVGVVVSDFSSHGVSAALAASMPKIIIDMLGLDKRSPSKLLMHINGRIKGLIGRHFLAAFHRIYDPCQQTLCFAQ